ncbi:hypothetical protein QLX08_007852 [Tetragonisca angustula]|uniref:Uncharacterized protein n=1 Tax=Tetragonisca angustula TaxID=166442 RepID=A0AAW0ZQT5_9HYME
MKQFSGKQEDSGILCSICLNTLDESADEEDSEEDSLRLYESSDEFSSEKKSTDSGISTNYSPDSSLQSSSEEEDDGSVCFRRDAIARIKDSSERSTARYEQGA